MGQSKTILLEKLREALSSVLPIVLIVLVLCFSIAPIPTATLMTFLIGAVLLIGGMGLFTLGADQAMTPIGERVGAAMTRSRKLWIVVSVSFLIGVIVTVSEPDLQVLATQVPGVPNPVLIGAVAVGVGIFLVIALLRILFRVPLNRLLVGFYLVVFTLAAFIPGDFLAIAFDSGGVTTGPMTVPFIMALGLGVSSIRSDADASQDSFGLVALCSIGPILAVMVLSLLYPASGAYTPVSIPEVPDSRALWKLFEEGLPEYIAEVALCLAPIAAFFVVFQVVSLKLKKKKVLKIVVGILYTYIGLVLFLTGVNVGFMPGPRAQQAGGGDHLRCHPRPGHEHQSVHRRGDVDWTVHGAGAHRDLHLLAADPRLPGRYHHVLFHAEDLHRHCLRLRRRSLRPYDRHLSAPLRHGSLRRHRRKHHHRRLRRGGHGGHDAADHHPDAGTALSVPPEEEWHQRRADRPGG